MTKSVRNIVALALLACVTLMVGCDEAAAGSQPVAATGVSQTTAHVLPGSDGLTVEQRNIKARLEEDNKPGAIKHLYIISPYSGQVILYSTVKGKVTSGGKRLTPTTVAVYDSKTISDREIDGTPLSINGETKRTNEVLQDDGTYGQSGDYLYWWDVRGVYHQHYLTGGQIVHVSSVPINVKSVTLNLETPTEK